jgi:hypothetical protein
MKYVYYNIVKCNRCFNLYSLLLMKSFVTEYVMPIFSRLAKGESVAIVFNRKTLIERKHSIILINMLSFENHTIAVTIVAVQDHIILFEHTHAVHE